VEVDGSTRPRQHQPAALVAAERHELGAALVVPLASRRSASPADRPARARVIGHENVVEAVNSWQPALCADGGPVYSFAQVPDAVARRQALGDARGPVRHHPAAAAEEVPGGRAASYAPVALGGLTVAFNIESQSAFSARAEVKARDGQRITELNLTPRLVAKLLTQSYRSGAANPDRPGIEKNPLDLTRDPEFLRANPPSPSCASSASRRSSCPPACPTASGLVFQWLLADAEAKAFLAGTPDPGRHGREPGLQGALAAGRLPQERHRLPDVPHLAAAAVHPGRLPVRR
jgi:hypothetical protein